MTGRWVDGRREGHTFYGMFDIKSWVEKTESLLAIKYEEFSIAKAKMLGQKTIRANEFGLYPSIFMRSLRTKQKTLISLD